MPARSISPVNRALAATIRSTAGSIAGAGSYSLGTEQYTVGDNGLSTTVSGVITDGGSFRHRRIARQGRQRHTDALRAPTPALARRPISAGKLLVSGSLDAASAVTVSNTATLGGTGTVGTITVNSGGTHPAPEFRPSSTQAASPNTSGSTLAIEINGTTVRDAVRSGERDRCGESRWRDAERRASASPTVGQVFTIVNNDDIDAVTGTFANLAERAAQSVIEFRISYPGGTGNDVT